MMEVKSDNIPKDELVGNQIPINISESIEKFEEEIEDLNVSYSDTSFDGGGFSSPPPGMIKI
jgi:archaellum component FlaC